jgi:hypothetical protein
LQNKFGLSFHSVFGAENSSQVHRLETKLSNLQMADFATIEEYIARFKNLKADILTSRGNVKQTLNI